MTRWLSVASLGALLVASGTAAADGTGAKPEPLVERSRVEVQPVAGTPIRTLSVDNPLGDVKIEGYDGDSIQIETRKVGPDTEALDRLRVSLVPNPDGSVRIKTTADGGKELKALARGSVRIDLIIRAPHDARVDAAVGSGKLEVTKMDGGGDLDTGSGPISVSNVAGDFATHSVTGPTSLSVVFGSVDAQTLTSDVSLDTIGGARLVASANRGKIAGRRVRSRDVELTTTDGAIALEAETPLRGRLVVASMKGDVDVKLRRTGAVTVRARGTKVTFGGNVGVLDRASSEGWVAAQLGKRGQTDQPAIIELQSRYGIVQFTVVE